MNLPTLELNPMTSIRDAWSKTNSIYGKISLVLFYSMIWLSILKCVFGLFDPTMMGIMTCMMDTSAGGDDDKAADMPPFVLLMVRGAFLFALAFLLYAHHGGFHSWNVGFLVLVMCIWVAIAEHSFQQMPENMYEKCMGIHFNLNDWIWVICIWLIAAVVGVSVDERMADEGTAEERVALAV